MMEEQQLTANGLMDGGERMAPTQFTVSQMLYDYDPETGDMMGVSVSFMCDITEANNGRSSFQGTIMLANEEIESVPISKIGSAVIKHINDALTADQTSVLH